MSQNQEFKSLGYIAAIFGGLSFGTIPILSAILRDNNASSLEQSSVRLFFGAVIGIIFILFFFLFRRKELLQSLKLSTQRPYFIQGFFLALMIVLYLSSISLGTPAGEAALLIQIHPIITLILGSRFLGEKITKAKLISVILAITGIILLTEPWNWESFLQAIVGDLLMILLGILYAGYLLVNRWGTKYTQQISPTVSIGWVLIWAFVIGIPLLLLLSLLPFSPQIISFSITNIRMPKILGYGFLLAFFGSLVTYGLIMVASKYIETSKVSILVLSEPIGAIILGAIILKEPITIFYAFGGITILIAATVIFLTSRFEENSTENVEE